MTNIGEAVDAVQEVASEVSPAPATFEETSSATDLKARLDWGEPALTILDVRDRESFNDERILGAISMPMEELSSRAGETLEAERDIYVYGKDDAETAGAVTQLKSAGFERVSALEDGLSAWKASGGKTEGRKA